MHFLLKALLRGDRRSVAACEQAVEAVQMQPALLGVLFDGWHGTDPLLRMRCADAIEKSTTRHHDWLLPFKPMLLALLTHEPQKEVRWHVAQMLPRLPLSPDEEQSAWEHLLGYTNDPSSIVKTQAMQALAELALRNAQRLPQARLHIAELTATGTPAMQARGRHLLALLDGALNSKSPPVVHR